MRIAEPDLWLEADYGAAADGSNNVLSWSDMRGAEIATYTPGVSPVFVPAGLNGLPAVKQNAGATGYLGGTSKTFAGALTVYMVVDGIVSVSSGFYLPAGNVSNQLGAAQNAWRFGAGGTFITGSPGPPNAPAVWRVRRDASNNVYFTSTGQNEIGGSGPAAGTLTITQLMRGNDFCDASFKLSALLVYGRDTVASGDDPVVQSYILNKYALALGA